MSDSCIKDGHKDYQCLKEKSGFNHPDTKDVGYKNGLDGVALKRSSDSGEGQLLRWEEFFGKSVI